jgi:hypothetical protein
MSLRDERRYFEAIGTLTEDDPGGWVAIVDVEGHLGRGEGDFLTVDRLRSLWDADYIEVSTDEAHVRITPKGYKMLGTGEHPPDD